MKKIFFVVYDINQFAGGEKISIFIANELTKKNEVHIISVKKIYNNAYDISNKVKIHSLNQKEDRVLKNVLKSIFKMKTLLRKNRATHLILIGTNNALYSLLSIVSIHMKIIFWDHASLKGTLDDKKAVISRKIASKFSNKILVLTKKNIDHYNEFLGTKREKMDYVYNPIENFTYDSDYKSKTNKIITVGRLSPEKGLDFLIEIAKILKNLNTNWQWDIWGDGPLYESIENMIEENNLNDYVFLKGYSKNVNEKYNDYSLYVMTSYREGLPLVLLEAKIRGLPIVSFDVDTGPDEIIRNNINGFLVKPYDVKEMAYKINYLLNNESARIEFSKHSKQDIEKFSLDSVIKKWDDILNG